MRFLADKQGRVLAPTMAIAHQAGISEAECHAAITRMIEMGEASTIDGGWLMTDHAKIQEAGAKYLRSEQNRRAQKKWRDKKRNGR